YTDPFAFSQSKTQWIDLHWFFQLLVYGIHSLGGVSLLVWTKLAIVFASVITLTAARGDRWFKLFCAASLAVMLFHARFLVLMRPILITILAMSCFIVVLERFAARRKKRILLWLVAVQLVWTNSQGLFILGPVILGCYWLGELMKTIFGREDGLQSREAFRYHFQLTAAFLIVCVSVLVNPYGFTGAVFPFSLFTRIDPSHANIYSRHISENTPLFALAGAESRYAYAVFAVTAVVIVSFFVNRKRAQWSHILLIMAFFSLAFMAKRNILLYFVAAAPVIAANLSDGLRCFEGKAAISRRIISYGYACILALMIVGNGVTHARVVRHYPDGSMMSPFRVPEKAVRYLKDNPAPGAVFNTVRYGGYMIWELYPAWEVYIDGRLIIRTPEFFEHYLAVCSKPASTFPALVQSHAITHVLLPTAVFDHCMPLVEYLFKHKDWAVVYADGSSILFKDRELADRNHIIDLTSDKQVDEIISSIDQHWSSDELIKQQNFEYLQRLLRRLGVPAEGVDVKKIPDNEAKP
ncbi:MAG: hypothetical protein ACOCW2_05005, partial [Chitinivibrionales bacterium]